MTIQKYGEIDPYATYHTLFEFVEAWEAAEFFDWATREEPVYWALGQSSKLVWMSTDLGEILGALAIKQVMNYHISGLHVMTPDAAEWNKQSKFFCVCAMPDTSVRGCKQHTRHLPKTSEVDDGIAWQNAVSRAMSETFKDKL